MNRSYEILKKDKRFQGKLKLDESDKYLTIAFHPYLWLEYREGNYQSSRDEGIIFLKGRKVYTHYHITEDEEALEVIESFVSGEDVYVEDTQFFVIGSRVKRISKEKFERKKEWYMGKKFLRIYTSTFIIKSSVK